MKPFPTINNTMPWTGTPARCGPTCLRMVAKYHGRLYSAQTLRALTQIGKDGVNKYVGHQRGGRENRVSQHGRKSAITKTLRRRTTTLYCTLENKQNSPKLPSPQPRHLGL
jgi:ABC-type bacteriocin/lantibiotic exporter with double-glycine peptidase domain